MSTLKKRINLDEDAVNQKLLTCVVCQDTFDQLERAAKQLPCNHTLCKSCLKTYCDRAIAEHLFSFSCPLCRMSVRVTSNGLSEFPAAFLVNQLLDLIKDQNCELISRCSKHSSQELLFCDTCSKEFCDICDTSSHINHDETSRDHFIIPSSYAIKRASKNLKDRAKKCISMLYKASERVSFEMEDLDDNIDDILEYIDLNFAKVISSVEERRNEIKELTRKMRVTKRKILEDQLMVIESEKAKIKTEYDKIKGEGGINQINEKVNELMIHEKSLRTLLIPKENCFVCCDLMEKSSMNFIQASIRSIGDIRTSTTCPSLCEVNIGQCFAKMDSSAEIITYKFSGERQQCGRDIVIARIEDKGTSKEIPVRIIDRNDGTYELKFIPPKSTTYRLKVRIFDHRIKTYPLEFEAESFDNYTISRGWAQASPSDFSRAPKKIYHLPLFVDDVEKKIRCATSVSLSSKIWLCASGNSSSLISIMDRKKDHKIVHESFRIQSNILCIASIPSISIDHVLDNDKFDKTSVKSIELSSPPSVDGKRKQEANKVRRKRSSKKGKKSETLKKPLANNSTPGPSTSAKPFIVSESSRPLLSIDEAFTASFSNNQPSDECLPSLAASNGDVDSSNSACKNFAIPTVWLGGKDGTIYIHREEKNMAHSLITSIKLPSPVVQIIQHRGKVFVALVGGLCCIFTKFQKTFWDLTECLSLDMKEKSAIINGHLQKASDESASSEAVTGSSTKLSSAYQNFTIRCMETVGTSVWLGYRNAIYIMDCESLRIDNHFEVDSREKARVTQITAVGGGAWCSTSLDWKIHLYSASQPYQHLQTIDAEPHMTRHLVSESFDFGKIISMKASFDSLWIGTNRGEILNIPYVHPASSLGNFPPTLLPECDEARKQLSLHGHGETVKFFLQMENFMISGGDGYHDRVLNLSQKDELQIDKRSHLIVWKQNC